MADDSTDLSSLLGSAPVQAPAFNPITTGGGDPFISPAPSSMAPKQDYSRQFSVIRYSIRNLFSYIGYFLAAAIISLSTPRTLILQYIPNTYTSGGVVSYTGAGVLGAAAVVLAYVINTLFHAIL
jgi:hypothetical protein